MPEILPSPSQPNPESRINNTELAMLGALVVEASVRLDLDTVAEKHVADTGVENPNTVGTTGFFVAGEVPMSDENVYRQVDLAAVEDLALSGVVRNGATARGAEHPRWGSRVFWHPGNSEKKIRAGGRAVIEADGAAAEEGWIAADKVKGIYAQDSDGVIKNILPTRED